MQATFVKREELSSEISSFWLKPEYDFKYIAGQFIEITLPHNADSRGYRRWFTLSSSPEEELISITTRFSPNPSSFKKALFQLKPNDEVHISHPMGDFVLPRNSSTSLLFVAIGIGVTPIKSMVTHLHSTHEKRDIHIMYAAKTKNDLVFLDILKEADPQVQCFIKQPHTEDDQSQYVTTSDILSTAQTMNNPLIYISGPEEVVEVLFAELKEAGIPGSQLVTDYFQGYTSA